MAKKNVNERPRVKAAVKEASKRSKSDPMGSYTGRASGKDRPTQDADDL